MIFMYKVVTVQMDISKMHHYKIKKDETPRFGEPPRHGESHEWVNAVLVF